KDKPLGSQSLFRGLQLIEILSNFPNGCPLAHLSELAGMNKSTVHRLLQGLHKAVDEKDDKKDKPLGSQSLFRGLQLIEILSNFPNGCPLAHLS
ncbi:helix-turn-helix domain-containing protein, partial [Enterobacter hormaechei]|uniref:helix-turn-helix domain-containing protein n=1 Tax=Enterobacter hormaechei TaxID=158836 RepID=UPI001F0B5B95